MKTSIVIADDHRLMAQNLADLIQKDDKYEVSYVARNGRDLIQYLNQNKCPDIALLDISMPEMDGYETAAHLRVHFPSIKMMVLSTMDREENIIRMILNGVRGYLLKECRPAELRQALSDLCTKGYYYSELMTSQLYRSLNLGKSDAAVSYFKLNQRERTFLEMACSDLTYAQIADKMCVSTRTVDGYREALFQKMEVKSRVGMALKAVRWGLVML